MQTTFTRCGDGWSEDTRITNFKQVTVLPGIVLCLLTLILLAFALPALGPAAYAEATGPAAVEVRSGASAIGVVPADGKPHGIRLRSQTVNAVISEDASGVWADTSVDVQLQNRGKTPVVLPVAVPGPQVAAYVTATLDMPPILDAALDKKDLVLYSLEAR